MGQKVNPLNFRLYLKKCWNSKAFIDHFNYSSVLQQDLYIREYLRGVLNKFKLFFVNCIIKRINSKTFLIIYYFRRPNVNFKKFIDFKKFNKRKIKQKALKSLKFKTLKQINKNQTETQQVNNLNLINIKQGLDQKEKLLFFIIWKNILKLQKSKKINTLKKAQITYNLIKKTSSNNILDNTKPINEKMLNKNLFSLKKIIKFALAKILNTRNIKVTFINIAKYRTYKFKNRNKLSKLQNMSRFLNFGFSKNFSVLTINLFQKAFKYKNVDLLAYFLAYLLRKNVRKPRLFFRFINTVMSYFYTFYKLEGIQIAFRGRINGAKRTSTVILKKGTLPLNTLNTNVAYSFSNIYTFYGLYSVKVWLFF